MTVKYRLDLIEYEKFTKNSKSQALAYIANILEKEKIGLIDFNGSLDFGILSFKLDKEIKQELPSFLIKLINKNDK